jgi:hypothetical protein
MQFFLFGLFIAEQRRRRAVFKLRAQLLLFDS